MTDFRCPLCESVLPLPSANAGPADVLEALGGHFSDSCTAVPTLRRPKPP